jgi:hypothetical protein
VSALSAPVFSSLLPATAAQAVPRGLYMRRLPSTTNIAQHHRSPPARRRNRSDVALGPQLTVSRATQPHHGAPDRNDGAAR